MRKELTRNRVSLRADLASDLPQVPGDLPPSADARASLLWNTITM